MSIINHEELKRQLSSGELTSLDDITNEFKHILKEVIQTASEEELTSHLGYDKHQNSKHSNSRNGHNNKTIKSKYGQFDVSIPRDRDASFEPQLVKKREILLDGSEDLILSLYTKGMSVRDIQLHLDDLYGYELSTQNHQIPYCCILVIIGEYRRFVNMIYLVTTQMYFRVNFSKYSFSS